MLAGPRRRAARAQKQRAILRVTALLGVCLFATGCDNVVTRGGWPSPVTDQGAKVLGVWQGFLITSLCVGAFVIGLILYSALVFRRRHADEMPRQVRYNLPIEVLYTVVPIIMVAILFYFTALRENDQDKFTKNPAVRVQIVGFQWAWQFNYLDDGLSVTGRPGDYPQMVLPVGERIRFYETSPDVIHAFWVVPFLFKRDVVPGHPNSFELTVTHEGTYEGKCTEFCGLDHDRMLFSVKAVSPAEYEQWLTDAKAKAQAGTDQKLTVYTGPTEVPEGPTGNTQRSHQ